MAEWPNAVVLKTTEPKGSGGSNPSLSATYKNIDNSQISKPKILLSLREGFEPRGLTEGAKRLETGKPKVWGEALSAASQSLSLRHLQNTDAVR